MSRFPALTAGRSTHSADRYPLDHLQGALAQSRHESRSGHTRLAVGHRRLTSRRIRREQGL